jgi:hypothetical protein
VDEVEKLRELESQIIRVKGELALREGKIEQLELELALKTEELAIRDTQVMELGEIKASATYKLMRKYVPIIDRYFPPGTWRGDILSYAKRKLGAAHV